MVSRSPWGGISQIIQTSSCSSTVPLLLGYTSCCPSATLLFLCIPGSQSMLLPNAHQHHLHSAHGSCPCSLTAPGLPATRVLPLQPIRQRLFLMAADSDWVPPMELELCGVAAAPLTQPGPAQRTRALQESVLPGLVWHSILLCVGPHLPLASS